MKAYIESASGIKLSNRIARLERDYTKLMSSNPESNMKEIAEAMRAAMMRIVGDATCVVEVKDPTGEKRIAVA